MELTASRSGHCPGFAGGGGRQLLSGHILRQELCVARLCAVAGLHWWPPIPETGSTPYQYNPAHGSDTGAAMWWGVPLGFIESRSLLEQGELPLWNRYGHAGDTLIGQAVSMLGDPLQLIVILGRGSAEAWDVKYVVAKFLFSAGFGLLILRLFGSRPMSLIYAALAAYCGVYFFIYNHPFFLFLPTLPGFCSPRSAGLADNPAGGSGGDWSGCWPTLPVSTPVTWKRR